MGGWIKFSVIVINAQCRTHLVTMASHTRLSFTPACENAHLVLFAESVPFQTSASASPFGIVITRIKRFSFKLCKWSNAELYS